MPQSSSLRRPLLLLATLIAFVGIVPSAAAQLPDSAALHSLHRELLESGFLRADSTLLAATALPHAVIVPPGGLVESREEMTLGLRVLLSDSLTVDDVSIVHQGSTAVVLARVSAVLSQGPQRRLGPLRIMTVFVHDEGRWRLLARSVTPCVARAIAAGRC